MNKKLFKERIVPILSICCSVTVIVFAALRLFNVWEGALYVTTPTLSIILLLQAYTHWEKSKGVAIFNLCAAILMLCCTAAVLFLK